MSTVTAMDRGREELRAARVLLDAGYASQALSRAYTAALHAAEAALLGMDETPSTPSGVVSAFTRRVVVQGGMAPDYGRALRRLYEDRRDVDHALADAPATEAERAIGDAQEIVDIADVWIRRCASEVSPSPGA
jgi:uncharacterized protein (UPF0332 family)